MIVVLSFLIGLVIFVSLGVCFSKIKIKVKNLEIFFLDKENKNNDKYISIGIYLYSVIKIFEIKCKNDGISILGVKISYEKIRQTKIYKDIVSQDIRDIKIDKKLLLQEINELGIQLNKLDLNLELGTSDTIITSFLIFLVASLLSFVVKKGVKKYDTKKHKFVVTPVYKNTNFVNLNLKCVISVSLVKLLKMAISLNKKSIQNGKTTAALPARKLQHIPN